jgi:hypothetical protein
VSKLLPEKSLKLVAAAILLATLCFSICNAQVSNYQPTVLTNAQAFLQVSYPELFGRGLNLNLRTTQPIDNTWRQIYDINFDVFLYNPQSEKMLNPPFDPKTGQQLPPPENTVLLKGDILFNRKGQLNQFSVGDCTLAHYKENVAIQKLVESHPEWSEAQAFSALEKAGARFGPKSKEELLQTIHLDKYKQFLGNFAIKTVEFVGLEQSHEGSFAHLWWSVRLDAESPSGTHSSYTLIFEPFGGKLTQILQAAPTPHTTPCP